MRCQRNITLGQLPPLLFLIVALAISPAAAKPRLASNAANSGGERRVIFRCTRSGLYADPRDCNAFFRCVPRATWSRNAPRFTVYRFLCPHGSWFDARTQACVHDSPMGRADCQLSDFEEGSNSIIIKNNGNRRAPQTRKSACTDEGFFADDSDCRKFYRCVAGGSGGGLQRYDFECGEGTVWDPDSNVCNHEWAVTRGNCAKGGGDGGEGGEVGAGGEGGDEDSGDGSDSSGNDGAPSTSSEISPDAEGGAPSEEEHKEGALEPAPDPPAESSQTTPSSDTSPPSSSESGDDSVGEESAGSPENEQGDQNQMETHPTQTTPSDAGQSQENGDGDSCDSEGFHAVKGRCKYFYRCVSDGNGGLTRYDFQCADGTLWDTESSTCNHVWAVSRTDCQRGGSGGDSDQSDNSVKSTTSSSQMSSSSQQQTTSSSSQTTSSSSSSSSTSSSNSSSSSSTSSSSSSSSTTSSTSSSSTTSQESSSSSSSASNMESSNSSSNNENSSSSSSSEGNQESTSSASGSNTQSSGSSESSQSSGSSNESTNNQAQEGSSSSSSQNNQSNENQESTSSSQSTSSSSTSSEGSQSSSSTDETSSSQSSSSSSSGAESSQNNQSTTSNESSGSDTSDNSSQSSSNGESQNENNSGTSEMSPASSSTSGESNAEGGDSNNTQETSSSSSSCDKDKEKQKPPKLECKEAGFYPHPTNCKKFYRCVDWDNKGERFSIYHFDCPDGTIFDPAISNCNHEESVYPPRDCSGGTGDSSGTSPAAAAATTTEPATTTAEASQTDAATGSNTQTTDEATAAPTEEGGMTTDSSGSQTEGISEQSATETTENQTQPMTSTDASTNDPVPTEVTMIPAEESESSTSSATDTTDTMDGSATTETTTSSSNGTCPGLEEGQSVYVCPTGFRRHPRFCNMFYQCTESSDGTDVKVLTFSCGDGLVFDEQKVQCVKEGDSNCPRAPEPQPTLRHASDSLRTDFSSGPLCPREGLYPLRSDCHLFIRCWMDEGGRRTGQLRQCPLGYSFWSVTRRCERSHAIPADSCIGRSDATGVPPWRLIGGGPPLDTLA